MATPAKRDEKQQQVPAIQGFRDILERQTSQFAMLMPKETVDRFKRVIYTTLNDKPELLRCTPRSLISVCMHAAQDGLLLDGREAAVVPFKSGAELVATYQPMVVGLRKKIRASDLIFDLNCQIVYEDDPLFDIGFGDRPYVHHKPALTGGARGRKIVGCYSVATFKDGTKSIEWMTIDQVEEIKQKSPAVRSNKPTPWDDPVFYPEMVRKTVVRRHAKTLPMGSDIENVFRHQEETEQEFQELPERQPSPQIEQRVADTVADTLDQFGAGVSETTASQVAESAAQIDVASDADAAGGQDREPVHSHAQDARQPDTGRTVAAAFDSARTATAHDQRILAAWERGKADKEKGVAHKAIPGEYRDDKTLWQAWLDGHDGVPLK
jgi:recombination protein RecT